VRFLIDADLSHRLRSVFERHGHEAIHASDVGLGRERDPEIARFARDTNRCLVTGDFDFADLREYEPRHYDGIVVLTLPRDTLPPYIERLLSEFLERVPTLMPLKGKLMIVEIGRIRVRE
jgi:predicted nuclease of predicted toxin-antitoxin system